MNNIKIGDVLEHKSEDIQVKIVEMLKIIVCIKRITTGTLMWITKQMLQENYIIPEVKWVPEIGQIYCVVDIATLRISRCEIWKNDEIDNHRLKNKLAFATKEETISRAEEILKLIN